MNGKIIHKPFGIQIQARTNKNSWQFVSLVKMNPKRVVVRLPDGHIIDREWKDIRM